MDTIQDTIQRRDNIFSQIFGGGDDGGDGNTNTDPNNPTDPGPGNNNGGGLGPAVPTKISVKPGPVTANPTSGIVKTIVSVIYSTAPKTFTGSAVYVTAGTPQYSSVESVAAESSNFPPETAQQGSATTSSAGDQQQSQGMTSAPSTATDATSTGPGNDLFSYHKSATSGASSAASTDSASLSSTHGSGMTGAAKAGIGFGVVLGLAAVIGLVVLVVRRSQKKSRESHERLDDEKAFVSTPKPSAVPASATFPQTTVSASNIGRSNVAGFNSSGMTQNRNGAPPAGQIRSGAAPYERRGTTNANDPANPFGNHAETLSAAPYGNGRGPINSSMTLPSMQMDRDGRGSTAGRSMVAAADFPLPLSVPGTPRGSNFGPQGQPPARDSAMSGVAGGRAVGSRSTPPQSPAPGDGKVHRVQMDFQPSMEDEIALRVGQLVKVQHEYDDGWALVSYMDNSRTGVAPRTCLSKSPLKPRPQNAPPTPRQQQMRGPPNAPGMRPMTPQSGRNSPVPRPLTPSSRGPQAPFTQGSRPSSPYSNRPSSPYGARSGSPMSQRPRANSNAVPYAAYNPSGPRSMSPGPYGAGGLKPTPRPDNMRRRSNSMSQLGQPRNVGAPMNKPPSPLNSMPVRKPVGGPMGYPLNGGQ